jgi:hypothetical protein
MAALLPFFIPLSCSVVHSIIVAQAGIHPTFRAEGSPPARGRRGNGGDPLPFFIPISFPFFTPISFRSSLRHPRASGDPSDSAQMAPRVREDDEGTAATRFHSSFRYPFRSSLRHPRARRGSIRLSTQMGPRVREDDEGMGPRFHSSFRYPSVLHPDILSVLHSSSSRKRGSIRLSAQMAPRVREDDEGMDGPAAFELLLISSSSASLRPLHSSSCSSAAPAHPCARCIRAPAHQVGYGRIFIGLTRCVRGTERSDRRRRRGRDC